MSTDTEQPSSSRNKVAKSSWKLLHVEGDLFSSPEDEALAHCISEDCRMGAGIAVMFKKKFGGVEDLKKQSEFGSEWRLVKTTCEMSKIHTMSKQSFTEKEPGHCAVLKRDKRFVYYLITKAKASQKPSYKSLNMSLEDMRSQCIQHGVTKISMPRIGCGLDRLKWEKVSEILHQVFQHTDICITVYTLPEKPEAKGKPHLQ
ncbi:ADP-ribose glycohydrolase OARD1 isoform X1 [Hypomesus transpacificus]|uniref:ADP-ribose glycohydrolase OARD1 isoform X1 n=1 Tax=Hypomesus transpacificus TaxID=137520 RepID=UPI001F07A40C|nr:ADP-ribose glycohydrolase OARD1 isoform X1 [Hypomesus transpacificus]XP_046896127.1 ADP-ribose glycohydrolase OARD1 isoform X1 [Hypomesus transpacificus]